jgi:hypothetical protein
MHSSGRGGGSIRGVLGWMVVACLAIVAAAVWLKMTTPDQTSPPRAHPAPLDLSTAPAGEAPAGNVPKALKEPVQTLNVFASRDPFEPLVEDSSVPTDDTGPAASEDTGAAAINDTASAGEAESAASTEQDSVGQAASHTETGAQQTADEPGTAIGSTSGTNSPARLKVRLVSVARGHSAVIRVDGDLHRSEEGETFADNFRLLLISDDCASLLYGDEQFTLCEGQEILK